MPGATFCTYFDHRYLDRGLVLYESLKRHCEGATIRVLALSDECEKFLRESKLDNMVVRGLGDFFRAKPSLREARSGRTDAEFAFTLTPFVVLEALKYTQADHHVIYLDADTMFFSSPKKALEENNAFDVTITPHNFSAHMQSQARYGTYNVGWVGFRKSAGGERCAQWWADRCLEWCHDRLENGKFADQKYLESFHKVADSVLATKQIGLNCAPWNASGRHFERHGSTTLVDGTPLILYHFAKVKRLKPSLIVTRTQIQGVKRARGLHKHVYKPYARALQEVAARYRIPEEWIFSRNEARAGAKHRALAKKENPSLIQLIAGLLRGEYVSSGIRLSHRTEAAWRAKVKQQLNAETGY